MDDAVSFDSFPKDQEDSVAFSLKALGLSSGTGVLNTDGSGVYCSGLTDSERVFTVQVARRMAITDPSARQIVRLYSDHVLGNGMSVTADDPKAQEALRVFLSDPTNRRRLSPSGQIRESDDLLKDGEWFIWLHSDGKGKTRLRRIDALEVTRIISNPSDKDDIWFYERETRRASDGKAIRRWYKDIARKDIVLKDGVFPDLLVPSDHIADASKKVPSDHIGDANEMVPLALPDGFVFDEYSCVHHVRINSTDKRGYSILVASMIWANQFKNFMENRIILQRARTMSVWDETIKGSSADVAARKAALSNTMSTNRPWDTNPPSAAGSAFLHNQGIERTPVEQKTAAPDAKIDGDMLVQMVGLGAGIFAQYLGQEAYRLTTTRVIEGPMMKAFKVYQQVLFDAFSIIFDYVLENAGVPENKRVFDIDFPPIVEKARAETMVMLEQLIGIFPNMVHSKEIQAFAINLIGINNVEQVLAEIEKIPEDENEGGDSERVTVEEAASSMSSAAMKFASYMNTQHPEAARNANVLEMTTSPRQETVNA